MPGRVIHKRDLVALGTTARLVNLGLRGALVGYPALRRLGSLDPPHEVCHEGCRGDYASFIAVYAWILYETQQVNE